MVSAPTQPADRLPGLDFLRGIAILWVMLFHSFLVGGLGPNWSWLSRYGWMGVDLFFVLSGFLVGGQVFFLLSKGNQFSFSGFYVRRAFRILPAYLVVLGIYLLWPDFREAAGMEPWWKFVSFTLNLNIDYGERPAFSHAWSLCVEEHFYLIFPALAVAMMKRPAMWKFVTLCSTLVVAGVLLRSAIWTHWMSLDPEMTREWFVESLYYPTWNRLDGFVCGVSLAAWRIFRPRAWQSARRYANLSLVAGLLIMALAFWLFRDRLGLLGNSVGWPVLSLGLGLLVFAAAGQDGLLGRARVPFMGWLAAMSYSLYLMHKAIYHVVYQYWGAQLANAGALAFLFYAITAVLAGAALHYAVERPGLRLRSRLMARSTPVTAVA